MSFMEFTLMIFSWVTVCKLLNKPELFNRGLSAIKLAKKTFIFVV